MYEKQTWVTGETITAEKLNHMEDGISSGGVLVVHVTFNQGSATGTCDTSYATAKAAMLSGIPVLYHISSDDGITVQFGGYFVADDVIDLNYNNFYHSANGISQDDETVA